MQIPDEDENGDPITPEDIPGFLGLVFDGDWALGERMGKLADFDWSYYAILADEIGEPERKVTLQLAHTTVSIDSEAWYGHTFIDELPAVNAVYDCPADQGPAAGSGYIFILDNNHTYKDVLEQSNKLYEALQADLERIEVIAQAQHD